MMPMPRNDVSYSCGRSLARRSLRSRRALIGFGPTDRPPVPAPGRSPWMSAIQVPRHELQRGVVLEERHHVPAVAQQRVDPRLVVLRAQRVLEVGARRLDVLDDPVGLRQRVQRRPHPAARPGRGPAEHRRLLGDDHVQAVVGRGDRRRQARRAPPTTSRSHSTPSVHPTSRTARPGADRRCSARGSVPPGAVRGEDRPMARPTGTGRRVLRRRGWVATAGRQLVHAGHRGRLPRTGARRRGGGLRRDRPARGELLGRAPGRARRRGHARRSPRSHGIRILEVEYVTALGHAPPTATPAQQDKERTVFHMARAFGVRHLNAGLLETPAPRRRDRGVRRPVRPGGRRPHRRAGVHALQRGARPRRPRGGSCGAPAGRTAR